MRRVYQADARVLEAVEEGYYAASDHVPGVAGKLVLDFKVGVGGPVVGKERLVGV